MSPVGPNFVPFPPKTGTYMLHPLPPPIVELVGGEKRGGRGVNYLQSRLAGRGTIGVLGAQKKREN